MPFDLQLRNWLTHVDVRLDARRPVTIVAGPNASGKTGIRDGLELLFLGTGHLRGIKTKGELAARSIRDDADSAEVSICLPGLSCGRRMNRSAEQTVTINDNDYKVKRGDARILQKLEMEPEQVRAALEADHLLMGDEDARRRIFFAASGAEATRDQIALALEESKLSGEDIGRLMEMALTDGFQVAQAHAAAQRAAATRRLREAIAEIPDPCHSPEWAGREIRLDQLPISDLESRERELETKLREASRQSGQDRGAIEERIRVARERHEALVEEGASLSEKQPESLDALRERAENARLQAESAGSGLAECAHVCNRLRATRDVMRDARIEAPPICPAIPGGPKCPMTKAKLETHRKEMAKRAESIADDLAEATRLHQIAEERNATAGARANDARNELDAAERIETRLTEIVSELDDAEKAINMAAQELAALSDHRSTDVEAELESRLSNLRELMAAKRAYDAAVATAGTDSVLRRRHEAARAAWDAAAKILAPDGLPSRLFGSQLPMLQDLVDEIGVAEIRVRPDATLEARVDGRWRSRTQLSESWRLRLSMAATHVVARLAHFPLLILDRFDHLDPVGRRAVFEGARRVAKYYLGGVLILATLQRDRPEHTGLPDVGTFWLHDGVLEEIG